MPQVKRRPSHSVTRYEAMRLGGFKSKLGLQHYVGRGLVRMVRAPDGYYLRIRDLLLAPMLTIPRTCRIAGVRWRLAVLMVRRRILVPTQPWLGARRRLRLLDAIRLHRLAWGIGSSRRNRRRLSLPAWRRIAFLEEWRHLADPKPAPHAPHAPAVSGDGSSGRPARARRGGRGQPRRTVGATPRFA